jgi:hypothetical protein
VILYFETYAAWLEERLLAYIEIPKPEPVREVYSL